MKITDEALRVARQAYSDACIGPIKDLPDRVMRAALVAALPHLLPEVDDEMVERFQGAATNIRWLYSREELKRLLTAALRPAPKEPEIVVTEEMVTVGLKAVEKLEGARTNDWARAFLSTAYRAMRKLEPTPREDSCPPRRSDATGIGVEACSLPPVAQSSPTVPKGMVLIKDRRICQDRRDNLSILSALSWAISGNHNRRCAYHDDRRRKDDP